MRRLIFGLACVIALAGCGRPERGPAESVSPVTAPGERALQLARETIILDGHIDVPYRLHSRMDDVSARTESGDFDFPRARAGGLDAAFMSIFTPPTSEDDGTATALADTLIDLVERIAAGAPDKCSITISPDEIEQNFEAGRVSLCLGMENGSPIDSSMANLRHFFERGVRYITLTHGKDNHICDSSYDTTHTWRGLSEFGRDVVREMNRLGVMVDVSHVSDDAFYQILDITAAPVIASHSSCRHFTPGFERNMSDDMISRLAQNGGVIQINFGSSFVRNDAYVWWITYDDDRRAYFDRHGVESHSEEAKQFQERYREEHPFPYADISDVADHIDHVVSLVGIDHVGLGSDFDGLGDSLPTGLKDVSMYPNLIQELLDRGYGEGDIEKIAYQNVFRVWRDVERVSREWQRETGSTD